MNSRIWRFGLAAVAAAALVVIGVVLLTGNDSGAQLSPSTSLAQGSGNTPSAQSDPGTLVFSYSKPGYHKNDLYLVRSDGTGLKRLTGDPGNEEHADWSPDGTRIVYNGITGGGDGTRSRIFVMNADGSGKVSLGGGATLGDGATPSWSPDGTQILFAGVRGLSVMNADGSGRRVVGVPIFPAWVRYPTWAPNNKIIFVRLADRGDRADLAGNLWEVNPDGSGLRQMTKGARLASPSVSPDGSTIAAYEPGTDRLIAMPYGGDGPAVTLLAHAPSVINPSGGMALAHWAPDGKRLVLESYDGWAGARLYIVNPDGSGLARIPHVTRASGADWRPE